jgi:hypothetical protein
MFQLDKGTWRSQKSIHIYNPPPLFIVFFIYFFTYISIYLPLCIVLVARKRCHQSPLGLPWRCHVARPESSVDKWNLFFGSHGWPPLYIGCTFSFVCYSAWILNLSKKLDINLLLEQFGKYYCSLTKGETQNYFISLLPPFAAINRCTTKA